jgi:hypothetical protein
VKLPAHKARLPGNVDMITGSAFLPAYLPTAGRQGGHPADLPVRLGVEPNRLKPVAPPHASESGTLRSIPYYAPSELRRVSSLHSSTL